MSALLKRVWRWFSPGIIGFAVLCAMSQIGNGAWDAGLLLPALGFGVAAGYTGRAVGYLRRPLGTTTAWVLAVTVWGLATFLLLRVPGRCPVELHEGRCSTEEASIWGVNAGLAVLIVALVVEQPRAILRIVRRFRNGRASGRRKRGAAVTARKRGRERGS